MCKYEIISVESSKCEWIAQGEAAHQWEKYTYFLCKWAYRENNKRPCDDAEKIAEPNNNSGAGSRSLYPCRVCEKYRAADAAKAEAEKEAVDAYNKAMKVVQEEYDAAVSEAKVKYEYIPPPSRESVVVIRQKDRSRGDKHHGGHSRGGKTYHDDKSNDEGHDREYHHSQRTY